MGAGFQALFHSPLGVLFTFPSRYSSTIGHRRVFSLGGWSPLLPAGFHVSGGTRGPGIQGRGLAYGALTRCGRPFHAVPLAPPFVTGWGVWRPTAPGPATPAPQRRQAMRVRRFGLGPLSLAATRGISVDFSSSGYLDVSVPRVAPVRPMGSGGGARAWPLAGSPIRRSPDRGPCAPPRGLSQLAASFVDFRCQGIRLAPLVSSSRGPRLGPASAIRVLLLKLHLSLHGCFFVPPGPARRPGGPDVKSRYRETQTHRRPAAAAAGP